MGPVEVKSIDFSVTGIFTLQLGLPDDWNAAIHKNLRRHSNNMQLDARD